jgi:hypothetical protein
MSSGKTPLPGATAEGREKSAFSEITSSLPGDEHLSFWYTEN